MKAILTFSLTWNSMITLQFFQFNSKLLKWTILRSFSTNGNSSANAYLVSEIKRKNRERLHTEHITKFY